MLAATRRQDQQATTPEITGWRSRKVALAAVKGEKMAAELA